MQARSWQSMIQPKSKAGMRSISGKCGQLCTIKNAHIGTCLLLETRAAPSQYFVGEYICLIPGVSPGVSPPFSLRKFSHSLRTSPSNRKGTRAILRDGTLIILRAPAQSPRASSDRRFEPRISKVRKGLNQDPAPSTCGKIMQSWQICPTAHNLSDVNKTQIRYKDYIFTWIPREPVAW